MCCRAPLHHPESKLYWQGGLCHPINATEGALAVAGAQIRPKQHWEGGRKGWGKIFLRGISEGGQNSGRDRAQKRGTGRVILS